jgi:hypothetical protein
MQTRINQNASKIDHLRSIVTIDRCSSCGALSLITFYAGGNYFILQQANEVYFNNPIVAMSYVFWCFTFIIPV